MTPSCLRLERIFIRLLFISLTRQLPFMIVLNKIISCFITRLNSCKHEPEPLTRTPPDGNMMNYSPGWEQSLELS